MSAGLFSKLQVPPAPAILVTTPEAVPTTLAATAEVPNTVNAANSPRLQARLWDYHDTALHAHPTHTP